MNTSKCRLLSLLAMVTAISLLSNEFTATWVQGAEAKTPKTKPKPRAESKLPKQNVEEHEAFWNLVDVEAFEQAKILLEQFTPAADNRTEQLRKQRMLVSLYRQWAVKDAEKNRWLYQELGLAGVPNTSTGLDYKGLLQQTFEAKDLKAYRQLLLTYASAFQSVKFNEAAMRIIQTIDFTDLTASDKISALTTLCYAGIGAGMSGNVQERVTLDDALALLYHFSNAAQIPTQNQVLTTMGQKILDLLNLNESEKATLKTPKYQRELLTATYYALTKNYPDMDGGVLLALQNAQNAENESYLSKFTNKAMQDSLGNPTLYAVETQRADRLKVQMDMYVYVKIATNRYRDPNVTFDTTQDAWEKMCQDYFDTTDKNQSYILDFAQNLAMILGNDPYREDYYLESIEVLDIVLKTEETRPSITTEIGKKFQASLKEKRIFMEKDTRSRLVSLRNKIAEGTRMSDPNYAPTVTLLEIQNPLVSAPRNIR